MHENVMFLLVKVLQSGEVCLHLIQDQFGTQYSKFSAIFSVPISANVAIFRPKEFS